ncbi:hypothetical protein M2451_002026 [Dysgonomonas sp. PFB1-18]|uniref:hypothetical protein n=1 Tax=unclassified Dysgonomonas TaxID=2630389 RepID=UPI002474493F|nr:MULTISPECIES: hypothetical protein [unclassified Dysgonomonas]MDH6309790.1 hypothetical protein [Dysgonomonas sp. PF1-14]MDH6339202.1 hypothetical protein [Dysgonomonas sp. PF1-16]MDH6380701.1 hypothetical protein [Dysgonomonas sp. PFB1-18]MDH6398197.1 hypothetical protein [Dysgonomonas sp. PF1-23]
MENKGLMGFMIAGLLAIIAFLVYWFFFRKGNTVTNTVVSDSVAPPPVANNPISPQDSSSTAPPYVNINTGEFGNSDSVDMSDTKILSTGFNPTPQETLETGNALSQRTNNPGALFWDGSTNWQGMTKSKCKSGAIMYFDSVDYGVRAQLMTLKNYYKKHGINTLIGITTRYAPYGHGNNNPAVYAQTLASCMGMNTTDKFNLDSNRQLLAAVGYYIHRVEAGYYWVPREKYLEWSTKV